MYLYIFICIYEYIYIYIYILDSYDGQVASREVAQTDWRQEAENDDKKELKKR